MIKPLEHSFFKRVYQLAFYVSLWAASFLFLGTLAYQGLSLLIGSCIGILMIVMMEKTVKKLTSQYIKALSKWAFAKWFLVKYPLVGALFYFLFRLDNFHVSYFTFGLTLPYVVIVLKAIGKLSYKGEPIHA